VTGLLGNKKPDEVDLHPTENMKQEAARLVINEEELTGQDILNYIFYAHYAHSNPKRSRILKEWESHFPHILHVLEVEFLLMVKELFDYLLIIADLKVEVMEYINQVQ
jgi:hypothetical protein